MKLYTIIVSAFILLNCIHLGSFLIFESMIVGGAALLGYGFSCSFYECCNDDNIPRNTAKLKADLESKLYGQQIARDIVYSSIHSHVHHSHPRKPLVLSFHGLPGSGKNYLVTMIANALFKLGEKSRHYHFYNGRNDFPHDNLVDLYQMDLKNQIKRALSSCARSLFVFDEVDKMPPGILDILVPYLDYVNRENNKSIFIFLSNTGSDQIVKRMLDLWQKGKSRHDVTLQDFESLITIGAFNEKGGLYKSATIESKLIDHHVPFLPMEEEQVVKCLYDVFKHWGIYEPTKSMIEEALTHVTYGPPPYNLYSTAGCKRLEHKVSSIVHKPNLNL